jgi:alkaline phosphatase D
MKNSISYKTVFFLMVFFSIMWSSCNNKDGSERFESDFGDIETPTLAGSEYLPTSLKDWQVSENRIECLVSGENRNLQLLTRELGSQRGTLEMTVRVGFFNQALSNRNNNWAGFSIGSKGKFLNYGNRAKLYNGIKIGVCTNGALFIGEPSPNHKNQEVINALPKGLDLKIEVTPIKNHYTIDFSTLDISTGKVLASISKKYVTKDLLMGDLVLVSNFESRILGKVNNAKSVWFEDWTIKGTKLNSLEKKTAI